MSKKEYLRWLHDICMVLVCIFAVWWTFSSKAEAFFLTPGSGILFYEGETADNPKNLVIMFNLESCLPWNQLAIIQGIKNVERQLEFYYGRKLLSYGGLSTTPKQIVTREWDSEITIHCALAADMFKVSASRRTRGWTFHHPSCPVTPNCIGDAEVWLHTDLDPWWEINEVIHHELAGHLRFYLIHAFYAPFATMKVNFHTPRNPERSQWKESFSTDDLCGFNAKYPMPSLVGKYWVGDQGSEFKARVRYPIGETDPNVYTEFSVRYQLKTFPDGTPYQELVSSYPFPGEICVNGVTRDTELEK